MKKLTAFLIILFLTSCGLDRQYLVDKYIEMCPEAATTPFDKLTSTSTCNGMPLLFAISALNDTQIDKYADEVVEYLIRRAKVDPNQVESGSGRNALMYAIEKDNRDFAKALVPYVKAETLDAVGNSFLHYLAKTKWHDFEKFAPYAKSIVNGKNQVGETAAQLAYANKTYALIWDLSVVGVNIDFLKEAPDRIDADFFFNLKIDRNPQILDDFGSIVSKQFEIKKPYSEERLSNYSLIHFAVEQNLHNLFKYLLSRGVPLDVKSSNGTPLAMALDLANNLNRDPMIEELLQIPQAINASGVYEAAVRTEHKDWVMKLVSQGALMSSANTLFSSCSYNLCSSISGIYPVNYESVEKDHSGNNVLMQLLYATYRYDKATKINHGIVQRGIKRSLAEPTSDMMTANELGQNFAHFFALLVPVEDYSMYGGILSDGFDRMIDLAEKNKLLNQRDVFGMAPLHYWLSNADRSRSVSLLANRAEKSRLNTLLNKTRDLTALNLNRDSILTMAVRTGNQELVETIIGYNKDMKNLISVENARGVTPLQIAKNRNLKGIYEYLRKRQ